MKKIVVIGSVNTDIVMFAPFRPNAGECVTANDFNIISGGKGANQAVSSARLGGLVSFIGSVGTDTYGQMAIDDLISNGVDATGVVKCAEITGTAIITVAGGDNSIVVYPGANTLLLPELINCDILKDADVIVTQLEIPPETIEYILKICEDKTIILNPAPNAREFKQEWMGKINYITPNTQEFDIMFNGEPLERVIKRYPNKLIVTLGAEGTAYFDGNKIIRIPATDDKPVDTTGAGDTFNGALAVAISERMPLYDAVSFANKAAGISITKKGCREGMPLRNELNS